jgi:hypothetical protein
MLMWTTQKPSTAGWYWMLNPGHHSNVPTIVQVVFDRETRRSLTLSPASHYPKISGTEVDLESLDAIWAGPIDVPDVLAQASVERCLQAPT